MKILLLLPGAFGAYGGIEAYNRLLVRSLTEYTEVEGGRTVTLVLNDPRTMSGASFAAHSPAPVGFSRSKARFSFAAVREAIKDSDIIVIGHVRFASLSLALRLIRPKARQWVITHGIEVWQRLSWIQKRVLRDADLVTSVSEYTREKVVKGASVESSRAKLLPCACDPRWLTLQSGTSPASARADSSPLLLSCARLSRADRYKGIDCVIQALPDVIKADPRVRYIVVGDGDDRPYLEQLVSDKQLGDHVTFLGAADDEKVAELYRQAWLFVMPSRKEGFGIVFLEAALFGVPSIAGNHGGSPEVVEDGVTGLLVEHGDVGALSKAIVTLLADDALRGRLGLAARRQALETFSPEQFVRRSHSLVAGLAAL